MYTPQICIYIYIFIYIYIYTYLLTYLGVVSTLVSDVHLLLRAQSEKSTQQITENDKYIEAIAQRNEYLA